jgi:organic radical activating enzyme
VHFNVSPKLANSHQSASKRLNPKVLSSFLERDAYVFKFVVAEESDLVEADALVAEVGIPSHRVYLMPQGTEATSLEERGLWLVHECMKRGYNYSHRLHVTLWGQKRGV